MPGGVGVEGVVRGGIRGVRVIGVAILRFEGYGGNGNGGGDYEHRTTRFLNTFMKFPTYWRCDGTRNIWQPFNARLVL
jgi:hypothetical protein